MNPPTNSPAYLSAISTAVYSAMSAVDSSAVWVMQGWLFVSDPDFWQPAQVEAYLGSVPNDAMIILDLMSDVSPVYPRTNDYFNKSYVWNMSGSLLPHIHSEAVHRRAALSDAPHISSRVCACVPGCTTSVATTA